MNKATGPFKKLDFGTMMRETRTSLMPFSTTSTMGSNSKSVASDGIAENVEHNLAIIPTELTE